jgi:hypothetical protein
LEGAEPAFDAACAAAAAAASRAAAGADGMGDTGHSDSLPRATPATSLAHSICACYDGCCGSNSLCLLIFLIRRIEMAIV